MVKPLSGREDILFHKNLTKVVQTNHTLTDKGGVLGFFKSKLLFQILDVACRPVLML